MEMGTMSIFIKVWELGEVRGGVAHAPLERARDLYLDEDRVKQKECEPVSTDECATERKIVIVHRERGAVKSWGIICSSAAPCVCPAMATSSFVG
ncbi:hypothetical protein TNCT_132711 [Trichonephila clavata]|uniref:Uncharacterized protein n=1 Tax=Trichonephila clavata TaxID=2740835 RepID=A0A8X6JZ57_TRICU|nr:hypothetical protein TNCT_132711 [Trichonephila clavata]